MGFYIVFFGCIATGSLVWFGTGKLSLGFASMTAMVAIMAFIYGATEAIDQELRKRK